MLALFALMQKLELNIQTITLVFGLLLTGIMTALYKKHSHDQDTGQM
jgi:hypothetical protein